MRYSQKKRFPVKWRGCLTLAPSSWCPIEPLGWLWPPLANAVLPVQLHLDPPLLLPGSTTSPPPLQELILARTVA